MKVLNRLADRQSEWATKLKTLRGRAWKNTIESGTQAASLALVEFRFSYEPMRVFEVHSFPKDDAGVVGEGMMPTEFNRANVAFISTPAMHVRGLGFSQQGLEEIEIRRQDNQPSPTMFDVQRSFFGYSESPSDFFGRLTTSVENGSREIEVRDNGELIELSVWRVNRPREQLRRFVFDLTKGGVAVYHVNSLSPSATKVVDTSFREVDGVWLPTTFTEEVFHLRTKAWIKSTQISFFDLQPQVESEGGEFSILALPVASDTVPVMDTRTGRIQSRSIRELRDR